MKTQLTQFDLAIINSEYKLDCSIDGEKVIDKEGKVVGTGYVTLEQNKDNAIVRKICFLPTTPVKSIQIKGFLTNK